MTNNIEYFSDHVYRVDDLLSAEECAHFIQLSENIGYEEAAINTGSAQEIVKEIRDNDRVIYDSEELAETIWSRIKDYLPAVPYWQIFGLNERFRFYRYQEAQIFRWHRDGEYARNPTDVSKVTLIIYLNDNFEGGNTDFRFFKVSPKAGSALVFPHKHLHQGSPTTQGTKYALRTDVMYQRMLTR
jgi:prolyl 4-hydroxylase